MAMDVSVIPEDLRSLVEETLATGHYSSVEDVLRDALRLLIEREEIFAAGRDAMRHQIAEGVAQAERGELVDGDEAIAEIDRQLDEEFGGGA